MPTFADFPVTRRWPATDPHVIQLYSLATPNGVKISITLEEMGLAYEVHRVTLAPGDVKSPAFLSLNPNGKVPAIIDPNGPNGAPIALFESGAILIYLAEKSGRFLGTGAERALALQWLMFQMSALGPMVGQLGFFSKFTGASWPDKRPRDHYLAEVKRLLAVLEAHLQRRDWLAGSYSIADIATAPWLRQLQNYGVAEAAGWAGHPALVDYLARFLGRPAVQRGLSIPGRG